MNPFLISIPAGPDVGREVDASAQALMSEELVARFLPIFSGDDLLTAQLVFLQLAESLLRPGCDAVRLGVLSAAAARRRAGLLVQAVAQSNAVR